MLDPQLLDEDDSAEFKEVDEPIIQFAVCIDVIGYEQLLAYSQLLNKTYK